MKHWISSALIFAMLPFLLSGADDAVWNSVWKKWKPEVRRQCPSNHLEWMSDGGYDDILGDFLQTLPSATQKRIAQIADYSHRCSQEQAGSSCEMVVHLDAFIRVGLLKQFATFGCRRWKCEEPALCSRRSR